MARQSLLVLLMLGLTSCGSGRVNAHYVYSATDPVTQTEVHVAPGPMPEGQTYTGAYHSTEIGDVTLEQTGDQVVGRYEYDRAACHATGRIEGRAEGNFLRFHWTEDQRACGRLTVPPGRGYFLLWVDSVHNVRINGEWGFNENEAGGGPWSLFRAHNASARPAGSGASADGGTEPSETP